LEEVGARAGLRFRLSTNPIPENRPAIAYGLPAPSVGLNIPFDEACWTGADQFHTINGGHERPLWCNAKVTDPDEVDLLGGVFRLLTLADEAAVPETMRDRRGIFTSIALPAARMAQAQMPLAEYLVIELVDRLKQRDPALLPQWPRWPGDRRSALSLTHDTDCLSFAFWREVVYNAAKGLIGRNAVFAKLVIDSISPNKWGRKNPFNGFAAWRHFSETRALKSCFYLFHRGRAPRDLNDCRATVFTSDADWAMLRELHDAGHEIGLHPSIHAKDTPGEFEGIKQDVEERLARAVLGVRHHYWAIDWRAPWRTWRQHERAGFSYDSSIAWRDIPGLRAGTSMPYRPYDLDNERPLDFVVVPCAIMDGYVVAGPRAAQHRKDARALLKRISEVGGIAVVDWHTEAACNRYQFRGYVDALSDLLDTAACGTVQAAMTPGEAAAYWRRRVAAHAPDVGATV
jgi:hypothetical protein